MEQFELTRLYVEGLVRRIETLVLDKPYLIQHIEKLPLSGQEHRKTLVKLKKRSYEEEFWVTPRTIRITLHMNGYGSH
jgi:hypothetical protein